VEAESYEVRPTALRVFIGYRRSDLPVDRFRQLLGNSFMPGTPYMLQPLGLAAYLPGVVQKDEKTQTLPDEFAIIAYPSQEKWHQIMNETLRGRVYNQTHGGVYDGARSHASFPVDLDRLPAHATDPYYLFDTTTDWQCGRTSVFVAAGANARGPVRSKLANARPALRDAGADQCIAATGDDWVLLWLHSASADMSLVLKPTFIPGLTRVACTEARRILCVAEPPNVELEGTAALNFIFIRAAEHFLR